MTGLPRITVVLLNYRRPQNIPVIVRALRAQTEPVHIFLWNNGGEDVRSPSIDRYEHATINAGCMARWRMARQSTTPYVMSLDDDLCPATPDALAKVVRALDQQADPKRAVGVCGARFGWFRSYRWRRDVACRRFAGPELNASAADGRWQRRDKRVDLVKGRMLALRREALDRLALPDEREDDLYVCGRLADGARRFHLVPASLNDAFHDLPERGVGNHHQAHHLASRDRARHQYFPSFSGLVQAMQTGGR